MMLYGGKLNPLQSQSHVVDRAKLALLTDKDGGANDQDDGDRHSDLLIMMIAYKKCDRISCERGAHVAEWFCKSHYLSSFVMYMIRDRRVQFGTLLADIGLIDLPKNYQVALISLDITVCMHILCNLWVTVGSRERFCS